MAGRQTAPPVLRPRCRWTIAEAPDPVIVELLSAELHLPRPVCRLLAIRGFTETDRAKQYLRPRLEHLHDAALVLDLGRAVDRLSRAIDRNETILVHGDYDVDGMCSTTILTRTVRALGGTAVPFIPRRLTDGYDLGAAGVGAALAAGASLVVTCDCGTSAREPIQQLHDAGIDVIVSDHHLPGGPLPAAFAVLNPKRRDCLSPDKDLAAVGVVFKLALELTRARRGNENAVYGMLDLVALATVADIAPLRGENRVMVKYGLRLLQETRNVGLRALIRAAGLEGKPLTAGRVGFILAPRLNAVGRLGHALRGVELLMSANEHEANVIARELEEMNAKRQEVDRETHKEARALVEQLDPAETFGIVLAREGWHPGVIGIVASRIVDEFGRPTILVALDGAEGKGSGRSISAFDLHGGLADCSDLLLRFGGHRLAAGITIAAERVPEFAERFNGTARSWLSPEDLVPNVHVDLEVGLADVTNDLELMLRHLEPCGMGNPGPVLAARGVRIAYPPRVVGKDGLRVVLQGDGVDLPAIGWGMAPRASELAAGCTVDVAFRLERDDYSGDSRLQARLIDFRA